MPRRIPAILAALMLAAPAMAQEAQTTPEQPIILPAPEATDANTQTTPETVRPASGSGCAHSKAVTS